MADRIEDFAVNSARWLSLEDFEGEVWKDINAYKGVYYVSNFGRVKSLKNKKEKILKFSKLNGYYRVKLCVESITRDFSVHRLVAEAFLENKNFMPEVDHMDGDRTNNQVSNLRWVTHKCNSYNPNTIYKSVRGLEMVLEDGSVAAVFPTCAMAETVLGIPHATLRNILYNSRRGITKKWNNYHFRQRKIKN